MNFHVKYSTLYFTIVKVCPGLFGKPNQTLDFVQTYKGTLPLTPLIELPNPSILEGLLAGWQEQTVVCSVPRGFGCSVVGQVKYSLCFARSVLIDQHTQRSLLIVLLRSCCFTAYSYNRSLNSLSIFKIDSLRYNVLLLLSSATHPVLALHIHHLLQSV